MCTLDVTLSVHTVSQRVGFEGRVLNKREKYLIYFGARNAIQNSNETQPKRKDGFYIELRLLEIIFIFYACIFNTPFQCLNGMVDCIERFAISYAWERFRTVWSFALDLVKNYAIYEDDINKETIKNSNGNDIESNVRVRKIYSWNWIEFINLQFLTVTNEYT